MARRGAEIFFAALHAAHSPQPIQGKTAAGVPGFTSGVRTDLLDDARDLMAEREGERSGTP